MEIITQQPPDKLRKIYDYLRTKGDVKVHDDYEQFRSSMADPNKSQKLYEYLKTQKDVKVQPDYDSFQTEVGLKKKDQSFPSATEQMVPPQIAGTSGSSPVLESGLTEDQEKQRNLSKLAGQPVAPQNSPEFATSFLDINTANIGVQKTPEQLRSEFDQKNAEEAGASKFIQDTENKVHPQKETNPLVTGAKSLWDALSNQIPGALASLGAIIHSTPESWRVPEEYQNHVVQKKLLKWADKQQVESAELKKDLVNRIDEVNNPLDAINYVFNASGQAVGQIPLAAVTGGASSVAQETGSIYLEGVKRIAQEKGLTIDQVIDQNLDEPAYALTYGAIAGLMDKVGAKGVMKSFGKETLKKTLQERAKSVVAAVGTEGLTEYTQSAMEQIGASQGSGKGFTEALTETLNDPAKKKDRIEGLVQGIIGATALTGASLAIPSSKAPEIKLQENEKDTPTETPEAGGPIAIPKTPEKENIQPQKTQEPAATPEERDVDQKAGELVGRPATDKITEESTSVGKIKATLTNAGKITTDEKGDISVKQNSGYPSQLFNDLTQITGNKSTALNEYLRIKNDAGTFKKKFGDWENSIMKDYGRAGHEYTVKIPKATPEGVNQNDFVWTKSGENGNPIIMFNPKKVRRDQNFDKVKKEYFDQKVKKESGAPEQQTEYKELYNKVVNKLRDVKLHLIHQELIRKQKGTVTIEDNIRSLKEIDRLNHIDLAKDYYGEPMIYMHGGAEGIKQFLKPGDPGYVRSDKFTGSAGIYFSRRPKFAKKYAQFSDETTPGENKDIYYAFLRTKNPYYTTDPRAKVDFPLYNSKTLTTEDVQKLKDLGYDSIIYDREDGPKHEMIVFDPGQVEVIGSYRNGLNQKVKKSKKATPKKTNAPKTEQPPPSDVPAATETTAELPVERKEQESKITPSTEGEVGATKSESNAKNQRGKKSRQERLLTQQEKQTEGKTSTVPENVKLPQEEKASAPEEKTVPLETKPPSSETSIGDEVNFEWLGQTMKGKITSIEKDRIKVKSGITIYPLKPGNFTRVDQDVKKATPKDAERAVEYNSKLKKPIGIVGDPTVGFMMQTDLGKSMAKFFQKQFTAKGFLPRQVFDRWNKTKGEISRYEAQIKFTIGDFKKVIREEYDKPTDAQITDINLALQGKQSQNPLPPKTKAMVQEMRDQIDDITNRFIDEGVVAGEMSATFTKNLGTYITRSYRKFDDPFWAEFVPEEVKNKAMAFLRAQYPNHSPEEMDGLINYLLYSEDAPMAVMQGGKLGSKDLSILKKRGEIAPEIRALMGEYGDPLLNYARSVSKMANLISKHHFLEDVKASGLNKFMFEKPTGKYAVKIAAEGSKTMAPLNGLFTSPEIAEAFQEFNASEPTPDWLRYYMKFNGYVKLGKTVFSVMTHARNFFGNLGFVTANAHWRLNKAGMAAQVAWANVYSNDKLVRDKFKEYVELGIVQDSATGGQLKQYLDDVRGGKDLFARLNESRMNKMKNWMLKNPLLELTQNLYQFEDDIYKIYAFENEFARYKSAYPGQSDDTLKEKAAEIVRSTYPTYSMVPRIVKSLRVNPLVGTFVSFPAEVIRTTYNTAALALEELSNPSTRSIGAQRLAGLMTALLLPTAASYYTLFALGMDGEDDDDLRKFVAPWQKNSEFLYLGREGNKYRLIDLGYSDPHSYLKRPIMAILTGKDLTNGGIKALGEVLDPFLSEEMLTARLIDVKRNEKETGDHVYNPDAPVGDRLKDIYTHLAAAGEPGTVRSVQNIMKGYRGETDKYGRKFDLQNEVTALLTGQKQEVKDIDQALLFRVYEIKDRLDLTDRDYFRISKSKSATPEEKDAAEAKRKAATTTIAKDALEIYRSAVRLGVDPRDARKMMYRTKNRDIIRSLRKE